jgi:hypothetical protein
MGLVFALSETAVNSIVREKEIISGGLASRPRGHPPETQKEPRPG